MAAYTNSNERTGDLAIVRCDECNWGSDTDGSYLFSDYWPSLRADFPDYDGDYPRQFNCFIQYALADFNDRHECLAHA